LGRDKCNIVIKKKKKKVERERWKLRKGKIGEQKIEIDQSGFEEPKMADLPNPSVSSLQLPHFLSLSLSLYLATSTLLVRA
jgi:hypothetical protein